MADETDTCGPLAMLAALTAYLASFIGNNSDDMQSERERLPVTKPPISGAAWS